VYHWLLNEAPRHLGFPINEIILAGDSAGGNLITALTSLVIKKGYKKPLALMMSYPA
jgi:acetyl esterase/lipase